MAWLSSTSTNFRLKLPFTKPRWGLMFTNIDLKPITMYHVAENVEINEINLTNGLFWCSLNHSLFCELCKKRHNKQKKKKKHNKTCRNGVRFCVCVHFT